MDYIFQIGDEFRFCNLKLSKKRRYFGSDPDKCLYPNKTFIISKVLSDHIEYIETRTSIKCRCNRCERVFSSIWNSETEQIDKIFTNIKKAYFFKYNIKKGKIKNIELVRTKNQRQREISLKRLIN